MKFNFAGESVLNPVTGQRIGFTARTKVDAAAIHGIILASVEGAFERAVQQLLNMVVSVTLPNNPDSYMHAARTGRYRPDNRQVKALKDRIEKDFGMPVDAVPDLHGHPVLGGVNGIGKWGAMPVVYERKWRRKTQRAQNAPDRILTGGELRRWVEEETYRLERKHTVHRVVKPDVRRHSSGWVWTTRAAWKQLVKEEAVKAGNFIFGWDELGKLVHSRAVKSATLPGGQYGSAGSGKGRAVMEFSEAKRNMVMSAENMNAPAPGKVDFVKGADVRAQKILDARLESAWDKSLNNAFKQLNPRNLKKLKAVQDYEGVDIFWE